MMNNRRDSDGQPLEKRTQYQLLDELWEHIISRLTLKDSIRASAVSKRFLSIATRVQKTDKPPLLMLKPKSGDSYELFDPFHGISYWIDLPELRNALFVHSKDGWLLMVNSQSKRLFLFRPYTRELIQLPSLGLRFKTFTFSAAPMSLNCMVFAVERVFRGTIQVITCRPGDTEWTYVDCQITILYDRAISIWDNLIFYKGLLYIIGSNGFVIYNPKESVGTFQDIQIPRDLQFSLGEHNNLWIKQFIVEPNGDFIKIYTFLDKSPVVLKLDVPNRTWVKMETLGGNNLFISYTSSHVRTDLLGNKRNNVYYHKFVIDENSCISYSFDDDRFFPKNKCYSWTNQDLSVGVWMDAPQHFSAIK